MPRVPAVSIRPTGLIATAVLATLLAIALPRPALAQAGEAPGPVDRAGHAVQRGAQAAAHGVDRGAKAAASGIERGARAAAGGIERGASAAGRGIRRGLSATADGVERGARATGRAVGRVADKLTPSGTGGGRQSAAQSAPASPASN